VCLFVACSRDTHDADVKALKATELAWVKDAGSKDVDKFLSYYADDATVLFPNAPAISGKADIRAALQPMFSDPNFAIQFGPTKVDVAKDGDLGYTQGTYSMLMTDPKTKASTMDRGKYLTIFKKQADGSWKSVEDMISSDMPAPGSSPDQGAGGATTSRLTNQKSPVSKKPPASK
jgi:uncharacterized protein (TIGR02246 family)